MEILSERFIEVIEIRYELDHQERLEIFEYLDAKYGQSNYAVKRLGPDGSGYGLAIIHINP